MVRADRDLELAILDELLVVAAEPPTGPGRVDDGVVGLGGPAASEVDMLLLVVGTLEDLDVRLERLLADVRGPDHDLRLLPGGVDVEGPDGAALVVDGGPGKGTIPD